MGHSSTHQFQTLHFLRIKGFATVEVLAEMGARPVKEIQGHLDLLVSEQLAQYRETRSLWQLTPVGREAHGEQLASDLVGFASGAALNQSYAEFLKLNVTFKELCGDWQLRDGEINDRTDEAYDSGVITRLVAFDAQAQPILAGIADRFDRFAPYGPRLSSVVPRVAAGESNMFTGVMCGSYHDVWMELHEDLILTQGIDRSAEGSF